jgi:hypothetical protein
LELKWAVAVEVEWVVEDSTVSAVVWVACPVEDDHEDHPKVSLEASHFNDMMQRRTPTYLVSKRMSFPNSASSEKTKLSPGRTCQSITSHNGFAEWEWGSYLLASFFPLIFWQLWPSWVQGFIFASESFYTCVRDWRLLHRLAG